MFSGKIHNNSGAEISIVLLYRGSRGGLCAESSLLSAQHQKRQPDGHQLPAEGRGGEDGRVPRQEEGGLCVQPHCHSGGQLRALLHQPLLPDGAQEDHVGAGHRGRGAGDGHRQHRAGRQPDAGGVRGAGAAGAGGDSEGADQGVQGAVPAVDPLLQDAEGHRAAALHHPDDRHLVGGLLRDGGHRGRHPDRHRQETVQHQASSVQHEDENLIWTQWTPRVPP